MADGIRVEAVLSPETLQALDAGGPADLVIGIPALNQARSILHVVEGVAGGLAKRFPGEKALVLVVDAGSQDGTLEVIRAWKETAPPVPPVQEIRLSGPPQRGRAVLAALVAADRLKARGCGLVDADLIGITPAWVDRLLAPLIQEEADFVSPLYTRTVAEGTLTTNLLAPMTRALYGKRIQQPLGGCAGLSAGLVGRYLQADVWAGDLAGQGLDLWLTTEALASGARVVETHLGRKMVEPPAAPPDLATTVARVVGPLFGLMERYHAVWEPIRGSVALPATGSPAELLPEAGDTHLERMVRAFRQGLKDLLPVWEQIMPEETLGQLYPLGLLGPEAFRFPPPLWARVASDFALAHHQRRLPRDHLLRALTPLYLGRVAAFLLEVQAAPPSRHPGILEAVGRAFEEEKASLGERWR